jgi:hypothetical protein
MTKTSAKLLLWGPRALGIAVALFLAMFALDAFDGTEQRSQVLIDFTIHLVPAFVLLLIVAASWRREWVGGFAFIALAVAYAFIVRGRADWILVISGPLSVVGILFLWSWWHRDELRPKTNH